MSIKEAQELIDQWIKTTGVRYFSELTNMAILTEDVGEVARLMSRLYGDQSFKETDRGKELSDELAERLMARNNLSRKDAEKRIKAQMPQEEKKRFADYLIDTSGGFEAAERQTAEDFEQLKVFIK